ncbi:MAG: PAC2 family protein [Chloroflexota bacterium]
MKGLVKYRARPRLRNPIMLAVWPGIGNVAMIVASYLRRKLEFKELAEIDAAYFFDPIGVSVKNNLVEAPQFPQSNFYYWKNKNGEHDVILFMGEDQPGSKSYELAHTVLDAGLKFQISGIYTCAAALTRIHHTEQPRVWGVATNPKLIEALHAFGLVQAGNLQIAGLNGLLLGVAKERNVDGVCLLGEVPLYATRIPNPVAALAVLEVMVDLLEIKLDLADMVQMAAEARERIKQMAAQAMGEYIDFFTEPIWERNEEGEVDDEDDEADRN